MQPTEKLQEVYYYTARPTHAIGNWIQDHDKYTRSLEERGIVVKKSRFKRKTKTVRLGKLEYRNDELPSEHFGIKGMLTYHEEKESDVQMAIDMLDLAYKNKYDKCILVSGDSDLMPAIKKILENFTEKTILVLPPPGQRFMEVRQLSAKDQRVTVQRINNVKVKRSNIL